MNSASSALLVAPASRKATSLPCRSTATRRLTASTSSSLWEMKMIDRPSATSVFSVANSASTSCGVRTAVGSSRMRIRAPRYSAFRISTRWRSPTDKIGDACIRVHGQTELLRSLQQFGASLAPARQRPPERLGADQNVIENGKIVGQREVLMHHADAGSQRRLRISRRQRLAEHLDRSCVRYIVAEQDADKRALAGPVLPEQRQHFARRQVERDVVVGDQRAEALGDAGELEGGGLQSD